jgi:hypothetical protein
MVQEPKKKSPRPSAKKHSELRKDIKEETPAKAVEYASRMRRVHC